MAEQTVVPLSIGFAKNPTAERKCRESGTDDIRDCGYLQGDSGTGDSGTVYGCFTGGY